MPFGSNSGAIGDAASRADARLDAAVTDFFLPDEARLDDRLRAVLRVSVHRLVGGVEGDIRRHAGRLLAARGVEAAAQAVLSVDEAALPLLRQAGVLHDPDLMDEMIARTRAELIAEALPVGVAEPNRPSLLVRLAESADSVVAGAAHALLAADSRRGGMPASLPAEMQHRLVWWVAAAIRAGAPDRPEVDRAIGEAARRCLAAHDEGERPEAVADRLVVAIDPLPAELAALLVEALGDRRLTFACALLARVLGVDHETARSLMVEPDDDRLWTALRGAGLLREEIARVALSLAEADSRRDVEAAVDAIDAAARLIPADALATLAQLAMPRELRAATRALARRRR
jgi:hypothetical protein